MNHDHYMDNEDSWDSPSGESPMNGSEFNFEARPKRRRLNPDRIRKLKRSRTEHRNLPTKKIKEMTLRKAKKLIYGARTPGRPSKSLSDQLREAKRMLQSAGLPLHKTRKVPSGRGRGRPKKTPVLKKEKRPRGRPRKAPITVKPKRPRGRPRKFTENTAVPKIKRSRGRPRKNPLQQLAETAKRKLPKAPES